MNARETLDLKIKPKQEDDELRIGFGSCYGLFEYKLDTFKQVVKNNPHLWIWMGDAAYTDKMELACIFYYSLKFIL
jgi:hypothetical protein